MFLTLIAFLILCLLLHEYSPFKYHFNNNNPFPFEQEMILLQTRYQGNTSTAINGSSTSTSNSSLQTATCVYDWLQDGNCNKENNNEACQWDKGDCCAESCISNCKANKCNYKCGTLNPYNCIKGEKCATCANGVCFPMVKCMEDASSVRKMVNISNL